MVLFLIQSLHTGGTERQFVNLVKGLNGGSIPFKVAVFYNQGTLRHELLEHGIQIIHLNKRGRWDIVRFIIGLALILRRENPQIVYSFLSVPNIVAAILKPVISRARIVWGIRASHMDLNRYDWLSRLAYLTEKYLSFIPDAIISNSYAGKDHATAKGFPSKKITVIPNGINTERFKPDEQIRFDLRKEWRIQDDEILIGLIGRFDPMKDHPTFLKAASLLSKKSKKLRFVCVGDGPEPYKSELFSLSHGLCLNDNLIWTGSRSDMPAVYNSLDIACSSSYGEGFSNVIGEAMACGVPCVVTAVGDSVRIVGDTGVITPPSDAYALSRGLQEMIHRIKEKRPELSGQVRTRIVRNFNLERMVSRTENFLLGII
jgi:glycosyltransferase involved in cell wall biosynthesis